MMNQRIELLVTTIVRIVTQDAPLRVLDSQLSNGVGKKSFGKPGDSDGHSSGQRRVLVVDDESVIADTVAAILNRSGYDAISRYSGMTAIEAIQQRCPDIIVSDVVMPDLNGIQLAKAARSICPNARVVLFSGNVDTASLVDEASVEGYFFEILAKPIHPLRLLKVLESS
ncbi:MAG TPA: response regulator [Terracidiphilus sp.]